MGKQIIPFISILLMIIMLSGAEAHNTNVASVAEFLSAYGGTAAGDTVTITTGLVFTNQIIFDRSGTAGNPIVIRGNNIARVRCSSSVTSTAGAYQISGNYHVFQNILFVDKGQPFSGKTTQYKNPYPPGTGAANGNYPWGLFENEYVNTRFSTAYTQGNIFKNCEWRGAFYRYVDAVQANFEMYNCLIDNIQNRETLFGHLVDCRQCSNVKIVNCKFKWNTAYRHYAVANKLGTYGGTDWGNGMLVEGSYWYFPVPKGETWVDPALTAGPYTGAPQATNEFNKDFIFRYNLFVNCSYTPISIEECSNVDVYNNTFINCGINPNWEAEEGIADGAGWPVICNIRIADAVDANPLVTVGEGADGRVRYVNICNNIFWSNHQANLDAGHIYLVDGFGSASAGTAKNADIAGLNVDGNVVWHTANAETPDAVIEGVNCHGAESWATALNIPLKNTVRGNPGFVNATGDTDGDYRPTAGDLPAPVSFTPQSAWQPQIAGVDPQGYPIGSTYVGAINPAGTAGIESAPITPLNDQMPDLAVMPNPYKGSSGHIYFTLPRAAEITLSLFDINGRLVKVMEKGWFQAGRWASPVRYQELAAGQYMARLWSNDGFSASRKMLIRK